MPEPLDHIAFLSQEVGPRPAGTEEEQQAALYITEQLQKEAGLSAVIEDFNSESNADIPRALCAFFTLIFTVAAMVFPVMAIPAMIVAALAGLLFALERLGKPILTKLFTRGVSQNVVAKYEPGFSSEGGSSRRRKIIIFANYDSGKVRAELNSPILNILPVLQKGTFVAMIFVPVFLLFRYLFFLHAEGVAAIVLNVTTVIALLFVAIPVLLFFLHKFAPYNEAANCNASGVAALLELACRVGRERSSEAELATLEEVAIHGEEAALAAGFVPEGAQLVYEASQLKAPEPTPQTEEDRLFAAKAAIEAMTGRPVVHRETPSLAENLVQVKDEPVAVPDAEGIHDIREETREAFATIPSETLREAQEHAVAETGSQASASLGMVAEAAAAAGGLGADVAGGIAEEAASGFSEVASLPGESSVPDWYKKAQENAKKPKKSKVTKAQRSRYATALDAAFAESSSHFTKANRAVNAETEERLKQMRDGIMEVSAPHLTREAFEAQGAQVNETFQGVPTEISEQEGTAMPVVGQEAYTSALGDARLEDLGSTTAMPPINIEELRAAPQQQKTPSSGEPALSSEDTQALPATQGALPVQNTASEQRKPIVLPDIGMSAANLTPIDTFKQQRAPLAMTTEENAPEDTAKSLLNMLPSIDIGQGAAEATSASAEEVNPTRPDLKSSLPSLSGAMTATPAPAQEGESAPATASVSAAGSFASAGATGTFKPVGDELLQDVDPDDIYIDDADDSAYEGSLTESGAFAGPGYVEMPKSRVRRFFDKFSFGKNKDEAVSAKEWLDVDEDFDAKSVGAARGGWESFKEGHLDEEGEDSFEESTAEESRRGRKNRKDGNWEGGAFTKRRLVSDSDEFEEADYSSDVYAKPNAYGLSSSGEMSSIQQFRYPAFDTEIWFVALGSELANNGGTKAFLAEHEQDLRGSIVINLEALASGELTYLEKEGFLGKGGASSRMKRYIKKASKESGVHIEASTIRWKESPASVAAAKGIQAMSVVGMEGSKPAYYAQGNDVYENINEENLQINIEFLMELLRSI